MEFRVETCTTRELENILNSWAERDAARVTPTYLGGRDWVVVAEFDDHEPAEPEAPVLALSGWEIMLRDLAGAASIALNACGDNLDERTRSMLAEATDKALGMLPASDADDPTPVR